MEARMAEIKPVAVQFLTTQLSGGREVWGGYNTEDESDGSLFFRFKNAEGEITKLRVSPEAWAAMQTLASHVPLYRDTKTVWKYEVRVTATEGEPTVDMSTVP